MGREIFINLYRMVAIWLVIFPQVGFSQLSGASVSRPTVQQKNTILPFKSKQQLQVEALIARTTPEYMDRKYGVKSRLLTSNGHSLRTTAGCEDTYLCRSPEPLPVTLLYFKAERIDAGQVMLNWETSNETNNLGFEVERSMTSATNFYNIGFIDGKANSSEKQTYSLVDLNASDAVTYYRLKQLDLNGDFEYSKIIAVKGFKIALSIVPVPNPGIQNNTYFQINGRGASDEIALTVLTPGGKVIFKNEGFKLNADGRVSLGSLPEIMPGLYIAEVVTADQQSTVSFIIGD